MKTIWTTKQTSNQTGVAPIPLIVWDFLKMFTAAVVYGVLISLIAAGIALLLASEAEAGALQTAVTGGVQVAPYVDLSDTASRR